MKKIILLISFSLLLFQTGRTQRMQMTAHTAAKMQMLSPYFSFQTTAVPQGSLQTNRPEGSFSPGSQKQAGFTIKLSVKLQPFTGEQMLLEIPGIVSIKLRQADPANRERQNYPAALMPDGSLPVLEAGLTLTSPGVQLFKRQLDIGYPLASLSDPLGTHEVIVSFTGICWTIYADNQLMDNDFAIGYPQWGDRHSWQINPAIVSEASIYFPGLTPERAGQKQEEKMPDLQYWTPRGHNSWVGDVATLYHDGRYHVFYLFDRRHHASKFGVGGHYFEHFSTTDFITWTEHEAATPIEEQWETIGTGTPFVYKNQLHISYGLHTSRIYPDSLTMYARIMDYYKQHQKTGYFVSNTREAFPSGSTYSVSTDNISHFKKSGILFHPCENPSVFISPEGTLKMFANYKSKGTWESSTLDSGWHCTDPAFPLGGDCTFYFPWGKYEYVVGGFGSLWKRPRNATNAVWKDEVADGKDFYNGINVPSVSPVSNGRYVMAGWIPITGWGGPIIIHEVVQLADGRLRSKWMPELLPETHDTVLLAKRIDATQSFPVKNQSFLLSFKVYPAKKKSGQLAVSFLPAANSPDEKATEMQINLGAHTAQYSKAVKEGFAAPEHSLRQGASPHHVDNYAVENLTGVDKPFTVRIVVKHSPKLGGSIVDTEIAAQNTLISYREGLKVESISVNLKESNIRDINIMKIDD